MDHYSLPIHHFVFNFANKFISKFSFVSLIAVEFAQQRLNAFQRLSAFFGAGS